jgi:hypothetical protein
MSDARSERVEDRKERELDPHLVWVMLLIVIALVLRR